MSVLILAPAAFGHVVFARGTLRQWVQHSAAALHAEIVSGPEIWTAPGGGDRQEFFRARPIERIAGTSPTGGTFDFFPHAEGFPGFAPGDRVLLFLERSDERAEFAGLAARFPWFSVQGAGEEWRLAGEDDPALALARAWSAWLVDGGTDRERFAVLLAQGLGSGDDALARDALLELIRARALPGVLDAQGVARFAPFVSAPALGIPRRSALFRLLAERPGFDPAGPFARLVADAATPEERRILVIQLGTFEGSGATAWLSAWSRDPDARVRRAVVEVQARRGEAADLELLARALGDEPGVARAAIRALGTLRADGTQPDPRTRALLEATAKGDDPERARWAAAELRRSALSEPSNRAASPGTGAGARAPP
jgi:hypothetical protein